MIARATGGLLALVLLLVLLFLGVLASTAGSRFILNLSEQALEPALRITGVSGSILSDLCADRFTYETESVRVVIEQVCVNPRLWSSVDFLNVNLETLRAASVEVQIAEAEPGSEEASALSLPIDIIADEVGIDRLSINDVAITDLQAALDLTNPALKLSSSFAYEGVPVELSTDGGWRALRLNVSAYAAELAATADLHAEGFPWRATVSSERFDLSRFTGRELAVRNLNLSGAGDLSSYQFEVTGNVDDELGSTAANLAGKGDAEGLQFDRFDLSYLTLLAAPVEVDALQAKGELMWAEALRFDLQDVRFAGTALDQAVSGAAERLTLTSDDLTVRNATVALTEGARLELGGQLEFSGALALEVVAEQFPLTLADTRLNGLLDLNAEVGGSIAVPTARGALEVSGLEWEGEPVGDLSADLQGSPQEGSAQLRVSSPYGQVETALDYSALESAYEVRLADARLEYPALAARAALIAPVTLLVGSQTPSLRSDEACFELSSEQLDAEPGRLCLSLDYPGGGLVAALDSWAAPRIPLPDSEVDLIGEIGVALEITGFTPLEGTAQVALLDLVARHPDLESLYLGDLDASVAITADHLEAALTTPEGKAQELLLRGTLEGDLADEVAESPISGSVFMQLDGIWVAQSLLPMSVAFELENVRGQIAVDAEVSGSIGEPIVSGSLQLADAGFRVLAVNTEFNELEALATLRDSQQIDFKTAAAVGAGSLQLEGGITGLGTDSPRLATSVTLEAAELVNLPDYHGVADGEISLEMGPQDLNLEGAVHLPRASVVISDLPETAVSASADEVIIDAEIDNLQQLRTTDMTLSLGDEVYLDAFGLSGRLVGSLRVEEAPGRLRSVTGTISLREARFEAYGQRLTVDRGQLAFSGPIDDPSVDLVASRVIEYDGRDYRISLLVTGTATDLQTELRSQPSLSEDDALALLLTGRTFSQISSNEQSNVYGAALAMGLLSATGVNQNVAGALNLEEIIVDQDADGNMEVGAAVRLNRNLYLRYTYGVFSRLGGVLLRYRVSNRISVQATTGDAHSIEIRYGVDE